MNREREERENHERMEREAREHEMAVEAARLAEEARLH